MTLTVDRKRAAAGDSDVSDLARGGGTLTLAECRATMLLALRAQQTTIGDVVDQFMATHRPDEEAMQYAARRGFAADLADYKKQANQVIGDGAETEAASEIPSGPVPAGRFQARRSEHKPESMVRLWLAQMERVRYADAAGNQKALTEFTAGDFEALAASQRAIALGAQMVRAFAEKAAKALREAGADTIDDLPAAKIVPLIAEARGVSAWRKG